MEEGKKGGSKGEDFSVGCFVFLFGFFGFFCFFFRLVVNKK